MHQRYDSDPGAARAIAAARRLGFRPAVLDWTTMRIHRACEGACDGTLLRGFERGGFFYTCSAAARACREWIAC